MATQNEGRLTIVVIISFTITFWLFITVLVHFFLDCESFENRQFVLGRNLDKDYVFKYHFVAALIVKNHNKNASDLRICDTAILNQFWTITAAHCLSIYYDKANKYHIKIKSNSHDWKTGQEHHVQKYLINRKYLQNQTSYDIALIRTVEPMLGARISFIKLANFDYNYRVNSSILIVSWSIQNNSDTNELKKLEVLILEQDYCVKRKLIMQDELSCAGSYNWTNTFCSYDSGAPIIQNMKLIGIVLKGSQCQENIPESFIKISHFQKSIEEILNHEHTYNNKEFVSTII